MDDTDSNDSLPVCPNCHLEVLDTPAPVVEALVVETPIDFENMVPMSSPSPMEDPHPFTSENSQEDDDFLGTQSTYETQSWEKYEEVPAKQAAVSIENSSNSNEWQIWARPEAEVAQHWVPAVVKDEEYSPEPVTYWAQEEMIANFVAEVERDDNVDSVIVNDSEADLGKFQEREYFAPSSEEPSVPSPQFDYLSELPFPFTPYHTEPIVEQLTDEPATMTVDVNYIPFYKEVESIDQQIMHDYDQELDRDIVLSDSD